MDLTVATGTFGHTRWTHLARMRAWPSVVAERVPWVHEHRETLAEARNAALERVETEFVVFLDADDELEPGYVEAMSKGTADMRAPSVAYVRDGKRQEPYVPRVVGHRHDCSGPCLEEGNFLAIGACVRIELLRSVGGFKDEPIWEDWSAFLRCYRAGGSVESIPAAVYRAHVAGGRNDQLTRAERLKVFAEIAA